MKNEEPGTTAVIRALGEKPLAANKVCGFGRFLRLLRSFPSHQRLLEDPHFIQWNYQHNQETDGHQSVTSQHQNDENGRNVADKPGREKIENHAAEAGPGDERLQGVAGTCEIHHMNQDHEHDRHRKEVKVRNFRQLSKRHGLAECRIGPSIVFGDTLW